MWLGYQIALFFDWTPSAAVFTSTPFPPVTTTGFLGIEGISNSFLGA